VSERLLNSQKRHRATVLIYLRMSKETGVSNIKLCHIFVQTKYVTYEPFQVSGSHTCVWLLNVKKKIGKSIPVTGPEGP
jgi:hypothetical protein